MAVLAALGMACSPAPPVGVAQSPSKSGVIAKPDPSPNEESSRVVEPKPLPEPDLPLTRSFHEIPLPSGIRFQDFAGFADRVWLLADDRVYEHDGKSITRELELCEGARADDLSPGVTYPRYDLREALEGVFAVSMDQEHYVVLADFRGGRTLTCRTLWPAPSEPDPSFEIFRSMQPRRSGFGLPRDTRGTLGFELPRPNPPIKWPTCCPNGIASAHFLRRDLLWLDIWPHTVSLQFDGKLWRRVPGAPLVPVSSMWADPDGTIWALLNYRPEIVEYAIGHPGPPPEVHWSLGRYDGKRWSLLPVPRWFQPDHIVGTAPDDIWFTGTLRHVVYQWDGAHWRMQSFAGHVPPYRELTFVGSPYMDSKGSLWLLGHNSDGWRIFRTDPKTRT